MSATIPTVPNGEYEAPFRARIEKPRDFYGPEHPSNIPDEPVGEVPPEVVFTAGGAIAAPAQARRYATFRPLLDRIGPGAGAMVEREMDRARAFEVIARAAVAYIDASDPILPTGDPQRALDALSEAVAENRAAVQP